MSILLIEDDPEITNIVGQKTSMDDVAREAGLSLATVYNHFGNKEELVHATVKNFLARA